MKDYKQEIQPDFDQSINQKKEEIKQLYPCNLCEDSFKFKSCTINSDKPDEKLNHSDDDQALFTNEK